MYLKSRSVLDRLLLIAGAIGLLLVVPSIWIWILYGPNRDPGLVYLGAGTLIGITIGLGAAMLRLLDHGR